MSTESRCVIKTEEGPVVGSVCNFEELKFYKFSKIPYAEPPLGPLRFLPPKLARPWQEEKDCTQDLPLPLQYGIVNKLGGSEDCLYLEVFTPDLTPDKLLPVMFWIGSCSFHLTINDYLNPITLIKGQDVIFITCHFRIGVFGFLSINDYSAPGNCGLKDVVMALKWVQRNVHAFGGDPNNITIFGSSSGASIAHLMMLSPMASGLFHKAIIQSATALNNWSLTKNPAQVVTILSKALNISSSCKQEMVKKIRNLPAADIMEACHAFNNDYEDRDLFHTMFKPCIEEEFEGQPAFLTKSPLTILMSGRYNKVPIIIGSNNIEGNILEYIKKDFYDNYEKFYNDVSLLVPESLTRDVKGSKVIGEQLFEFYFGHKAQLTRNSKVQYLQLVSDYYFLYYVNKAVKLHGVFAREHPVYYYIMNYSGRWFLPESLDFFNNSLGHCGELPFLFKIMSPESQESSECLDSKKARKRMIKMWTNFAKYGNPTPDEDDPILQIKWDPVENSEKLNYLNIGTELTKGRNPFLERMTFWDKLYKEHVLLRALLYFDDMGVDLIW